MGEQSAKHLRGRSMEDVIFNGSESRAAHDFAEVTLTFENNDGDAPLEYKDYAEIAVTRRLHRNGDSEYLVNKTQVRLKDITDLFLGTGAGTKAYAIVEQGKIGLIVSAKPDERRLLIEEAAGITKFKSKKKQAEKKMELTQLNLLRVGDIVAEIERNLGALKRQAAKAERYLAYRNELEDHQLHEASHRYLELYGWIKFETGEVARLTLDADQAKSALVAREAELESARLEAHAAEQALEKSQAENFAAENEVRTEEGAIARAKDKIDALLTRERQAAKDAHEIIEQNERLSYEREMLTSQVDTLAHEETGFAEQLDAEEERLSELGAEQQRADGKVAELRKDTAHAQADIASGEARLAGFERRQNEMHSRLERMRVEREDQEAAQLDYAARVRELSEAVQELRVGKVTSAEEKNRLEARLAELRQRILGEERALDEAKSEFSKKRSRLHALEEMQARLEGVGTGIKSLLATKDPTLLGLVADRIEAPADLTSALAGLLGSRLQEVRVQDLQRGRALLEQLAKNRKGRATLVPTQLRFVAGGYAPVPQDEGVVARLADRLRYKPEDESLVRSLVGDALVVRDAEVADRIGFHAAPLVTLDGTVFFPDGRVAGGQGEEAVAHMLDSKRETRELREDVTRLEALVTERLTAHQASRVAISDTGAALDRARHQAHADEIALITTEKDLRQVQVQLETVRKRLEILAAEQDDLSMAIHEAGQERSEARAVLDEARAVLDEASGRMEDAEAAASSWREQVEARRQIVTERKVRVASVREKLNAARATLGRLSRSTDELAERRRRLEQELLTGAQAIGETAGQLVVHKQKRQRALDHAQSTGAALAGTRGIFEALRGALLEREAKLKDLRTRVEQSRDELATHDMNLREKQMELSHLLEGVAEKFRGLRLPRVIGDYHLRLPPDAALRSRIADLVQLIERMGSVNLDAMREHDEAQKRFTFYSEQKADLDQALSDLEKAIQ
jgi:chromosome segregation protein